MQKGILAGERAAGNEILCVRNIFTARQFACLLRPDVVYSPLMRALLLSLMMFGTACAADWRAGREHEIESANLPKPAKVYLPENWSAEKKWPVIFFYPWTGGRANTSVMRDHTGGRDFIVIG